MSSRVLLKRKNSPPQLSSRGRHQECSSKGRIPRHNEFLADATNGKAVFSSMVATPAARALGSISVILLGSNVLINCIIILHTSSAQVLHFINFDIGTLMLFEQSAWPASETHCESFKKFLTIGRGEQDAQVCLAFPANHSNRRGIYHNVIGGLIACNQRMQ
ncbi:hypothetical protein B296_00046090 [Ensete ventricosum]|uniref:Uncharacterized protein n=1 Tax=Ensete ventricosum TaxID=4639 RepID=A0A426XSJ2_ENSVE|nr:hypothetical protein B296_00046090 [Ensete ventricosum]